MSNKAKNDEEGIQVIQWNKRAFFNDHEITDRIECGLALNRHRG